MTFLYPTASTTAIFINGYHVEQAYQLQYKETVNKIPIYGYSDYTYSKIAVGRTIVQGILVINFISPGYLAAVLSDTKPDTTPKKLRNYGFSSKYNTEKDKLKDDLENEIRTELPTLDSEESRRARAEYIVASLYKNADDITKIMFTEILYKAAKQGDKVVDRIASNTKRRDSSISINDRNDVILDVYYTDPQYALWWVRFNKVHFYETSQTISQAGAEGSSDPLYEVYPWIASEKKIMQVT